MRLLSSLITFLAFTFFTSINASPIPLELLDSRDTSVVAVRNDNTHLPTLSEGIVAVHDPSEWKDALTSKHVINAHAALTSIGVSVIAPLGLGKIRPIAGSQAPVGLGNGGADWRRHFDGPPDDTRHPRGSPDTRHFDGPPDTRHTNGPPDTHRTDGPPDTHHTDGPPDTRRTHGSPDT